VGLIPPGDSALVFSEQDIASGSIGRVGIVTKVAVSDGGLKATLTLDHTSDVIDQIRELAA